MLGTVAATLLDLHDQCSGRYPCPSAVFAVAVDVGPRLKCAAVLQCVVDRLLPTIAAQKMEMSARCPSAASLYRYGGRALAAVHAMSEGGDTSSEYVHAMSGHPVFKLIVQTIVAHSREHHDGGWCFAYVFAKTIARLLWESSWYAAASLAASVASMREGLFTTLLWSSFSDALIRCGVVRRIASRDDLALFVRCRLRLDCWVRPSTVATWCGALVDNFACCCEVTNGVSRIIPERLRIRCMPHEGLLSPAARVHHMVLRGIVLDWQLPIEVQLMYGAEGMTNSSVGYRTLLFTECLASEDAVPLAEWLNASVAPLHVIACQKTVADIVKETLYRQFNVVVLERLAATNITQFHLVTGGTMVSSVQELRRLDRDVVHYGSFVKLYSKPLGEGGGGRYAMMLEGHPASCSVVTLLLLVDTELPLQMQALVQEQCSEGFLSLCTLFSKGAMVVEGSGGFERRVAQYLRASLVYGSNTKSKRQLHTRAATLTLCDTLDAYHSSFNECCPRSLSVVVKEEMGMLQLVAFLTSRRRAGPLPLMLSDANGPDGLEPLHDCDAVSFVNEEEQRGWATLDSWWCKRDVLLRALDLHSLVLGLHAVDVDISPHEM